MIYSILVINHHGHPRLTKFYDSDRVPFAARDKVIKQVFQTVSKRPDNVCNFVESADATQAWGEGVRLIYRHYATLYFVLAVDESESELGILDLIQVFVEALDKCFENVCELDLIFNPNKAHFILDEIVMAGMVLETSLKEIVHASNGINKYEANTQKLATQGKGKQIGRTI